MRRNQLMSIFIIIIALAIVAAPSTRVHAQEDPPEEDCGFLGLGCGWLADILSGIYDAIRGFFDFIGAALRFIIDFLAGILQFIIDVILAIVGLVRDVFRIVRDFINAFFRFIDEVFHIVAILIAIIIRLAQLIAGWLVQAISIAFNFLNTFSQTAPSPLPGLPQCVTNPLASELCALYYMSDWTIFAPNTPGALIPGLLTIVIDSLIIFFFIRKVMSIINTGEGTADV